MSINGEVFQIETYMQRLIGLMKERFGARMLYVGLQGSYLRGEATQSSDIDVMVVLDALTVADMDAYTEMLKSVGDYERSCGFICGLDELKNWNPLEICHLLHTTKDYYGVLAELTPAYTRDDVRNNVKMNVCNLFHAICHRYIHGGREACAADLPGAYKATFFILQNVHYLNTGIFPASKSELLPLLSGKDRQVLEISIGMKSGGAYDFDAAYALLFDWCKETMTRIWGTIWSI